MWKPARFRHSGRKRRQAKRTSSSKLDVRSRIFINPVGRAYYGFSTLLCTPASLSQPVGAALGTQAGPARIRDVTVAAGFRGFRLVASTPFNNVFEVRP